MLLNNGEFQFQTFLNERLMDKTMSIEAPIQNNDYELSKTTNDAVNVEKKKLIYKLAFRTKIRESIRVRNEASQ